MTSNHSRGITAHVEHVPLRAARWARVSSNQQAESDREGLPYQHDMQSEAIELLGAVDTGIGWEITHSGGFVHERPEWREMLARAGTDFTVLIVPYVSRLGRNTIESLTAVEAITAAGASVYFCEEAISTKNERQWSAFAGEVIEAESYRRKLKRTMARTYDSKWRRRSLPGGRPPFGYAPDWSHDAIAAATMRTAFAEYAEGNISEEALAARHGIKPEAMKEMLRNRTYTGMAGRKGEWKVGAFEPIITQELFDRCARVRASRKRAGGPAVRQPNMLHGKLWCACGSSVRLDGRDGVGQQRVMHPETCETWGPTKRRQARYYTEPLIAALSQMEWTPQQIERLAASASTEQAPTPIPTNWARERKQLAEDFGAQRVSVARFMGLNEELIENERLERDDRNRGARAARNTSDTSNALSDFSAFVAQAKGDRQQKMWAILASHYFERFEHLGENLIRPVPNERGMQAFIASTMPSRVVLARPEGFEPPTC